MLFKNEDFIQQETTRAYLQFPNARRLVLLMRDFKVVDLSLTTKSHYSQKGAAFALLGSDGDALSWKESEISRESYYPVYTLKTTDVSGAAVTMTAFSDSAETPMTYFRVKVQNLQDDPVCGCISVLPQTADDDKYLTGMWDTGYCIYEPNLRAWTMLDSFYEVKEQNENGLALSDGYASLYLSGGRFAFTGDTPHNFDFGHFATLSYHLAPGEELEFQGGFTHSQEALPKPFAEAYGEAKAAWDAIYGKIQRKPDTDDAKIHDIFMAQVTTCLQMLARYEDGVLYPRQGCVGRNIWAWEAMYTLDALDAVGLWDYTTEPYETLLTHWMITDENDERFGLIDNPHVVWANTNGSVLYGISRHLLHRHDPVLFEKWRPYLYRAFTYVERQRHRSKAPDVEGLFPAAVSSDWLDVGQHFTFTDGVNLMGCREYLKMLQAYGAEEAETVQADFADYEAVFRRVCNSLSEGHELTDDPNHPDFDYMPTSILGRPFRKIRTHCYTGDGIIYLPVCGNLDVNDKLLAFVQRYYDRHGLLDHDLASRMTNLDFGYVSVYGDCYYTVVAEMSWYDIYKKQGRPERADAMLRSMLYYGLTREMLTAERYTPMTKWYAPWQPNGSASGRIILVLGDRYGWKNN